MTAEVTTGREYGTDRPCQIGRLEYTFGFRHYVALTFRYLEKPSAWRLTWIGEKGRDASHLPEGISPSNEMLLALAEATE